VALAAWVVGSWQDGPRAVLAWAAAAGLLLLAGASTLRFESLRPQASAEAWAPERVAAELRAGRPVFVDFTAAWCVTCQVNKRVALHNASVVSAFAAHDVATLKADWTRQDPRITATLAALGRNAVPVYALYLPGEDAPRLLPEVLTPALVLAEIEKLPAAKTAVTQR